MKTLIALVSAFASSLALAASTTVSSGNTFGVLRVDVGSADEVIIAIPWLASSTSDTSIKVTDVIKTANLAAGDQLYYYNTTTKKYQVWQLSSTKEWVGAENVSDETTEAASDTTALNRGDAILLKRPGTKSESIYLYGQVPSSSTCEVTMAQGTSSSPAYTLIAPPAASETDLNNATWANVGSGDYIVLETGTILNYVTINDATKWAQRTGFDETTNKDTYDATAAKISAGMGAWYVSRSSDTTASTVTWAGLPSTSN